MKIALGTSDDFFKRSLDRARKLDRGEPIEEEMRLTFEDPAEMQRYLDAQATRDDHPACSQAQTDGDDLG